MSVVPEPPKAEAGVTTITAPQDLTLTTTGTSISVTWGQPTVGASLVTGFQVDYSTDGSTWITASNSIPSTTPSFTITGLVSGTSYYVRVAAIFSGGLGPWAYPWTKLYGTVTPYRTTGQGSTTGSSSGVINYEPGFGLSSIGNQAANRFASAAFTRVRYEMQYFSSSGTVYNYVNADFARWNQVTGNAHAPSGTYTTPAASVATLAIPDATTSNVIQTPVSDLTVESSLLGINDNGLSGRLEIWANNYGLARGASGVSDGSADIYDQNDRPDSAARVGYGSFQVHDLTNSRTVFAWNRHESSTNPDIGIGPGSCSGQSSTDWTFCGQASGPTLYSAANRSDWRLEVFINAPIRVTSAGLIARYDAKNSASWSGSGSTWNDVSGNSRNVTLQNSLTSSLFSVGSHNIRAMQFNSSAANASLASSNASGKHGVINSDFNTDFSAGFSIGFYADFGGSSQSWERIIDIGNGSNAQNILVARAGNTSELVIEIYNGSTSAGQCKALNAIDVAGTWAHWGIVLNGSTCTFYKNGVLFTGSNNVLNTATSATSSNGSVAYTGLPTSNISRSNAWIGRSNWQVGDGYFEGAIADIAIYNVALSQSEILSLREDQIATTVNAASGSCAARVNNPTNVTVTSVASDCLIQFSAVNNVTTNNRWIAPSNVTAARVLVVAGGGGGGSHVGGGGGGGGFIDRTLSVSPNSMNQIGVGAGGAASGQLLNVSPTAPGSGANSFFGPSLIALGGGNGAVWTSFANSTGGSGGGGTASGGSWPNGSASSNSTQGHAGGSSACTWQYSYPTGGGGGAGGPGEDGSCAYIVGKSGDGGIGRRSDITGTALFYAGGGGGGLHGGGTFAGYAGRGGSGGGGDGAGYLVGVASAGACSGVTVTATQGTDGLGGGGGGAGAPWSGSCNSISGRGGSGVVIVRYGTTTLSINQNNGSGFSGTSTFTGSTYTHVTLPTASGITRNGFVFAGWNTASNGRGTNYAPGSVFQLNGNQTLFARWEAVVSYNSNGATSTRSIETTTVYGGETSTPLSVGRLTRDPVITSGLRVHLDASNPASYSGTGTIWRDLSGNGNNATLVNSPVWESSTGSFRFDGVNDHATLGNLSGFGGTSPYTLSITFKTDEPMRTQGLLTKFNRNVAGYQRFELTSGRYALHREVSGGFTSSRFSDPSVIEHASMTYDGTTMRLYVNGVLFESQLSGSVATTAAVDNIIGAGLLNSNATEFFSGRIYNVQIYTRALSQAEVLQNYRALDPFVNVFRTGSTLTGWSTTSDTSTPVITNGTNPYLNTLPTPYYRLEARNYNGTTWTPSAGSTANLSLIYSTNRPTLNTNQTGWGATGVFSTVSGAAANQVYISLNNPRLTTYTLCGLARYRATGITAPTMGRIFTGPNNDGNYFAGWQSNGTRNFHNNAWKLNGAVANDYNWHYFCDSGNTMYWDGTRLTPTTYVSTTSLPTLHLGGNINGGEYSDFEIAEVQLYDQFLTADQISNINRYFKNTYGIVAGAVDTATTTLNSPFSYAPTGTTTLFARWGATITYDGNNQTQGTAPAPSVFANGTGNVATNTGNLTQLGESFYGWNTRADGTGTFYAPGATYTGGDVTLFAQYRITVKIQGTTAGAEPITLLPYMRFKASDFDATRKVWYDSSGNSRNTSFIRGSPTVVTTTVNQNGSTRAFSTVRGGASDGVQFKNPLLPDNSWTLFTIARLTTSQVSSSARLFDGESGNQLFGFYGNSSGVMHSGAWVSPNSGNWTATSSSNAFGQNWVVSTSQADLYRGSGVSRTTSSYGTVTFSGDGSTNTLAGLTINAGQFMVNDYSSGWEVAEVIIFDRRLSLSEIRQVEDHLASTYGITGYTNQNQYTDTLNLTTTLGSSLTSDSITATFGLNNSFTLAPPIPGITLNTAANSASITVAPTVAVGTYLETLTVTDAIGSTSVLPVTITVAPPLRWSDTNVTTVQSTYGRQFIQRLDLSGGTGTRRFTLNHMSNPSTNSITIDTTTAASGFIRLLVDSSTAVGTYVESITVTDNTRAIRTLIVTVTVNPLPTIAYPTAGDLPAISQRGLLVRYEMDSRTSYSGTGTTVTDLMGNSNGFVSGSPAFSRDFNGYLTFSGSQYIQTRTGLTSTQVNESISVFMWVYPTGDGIILDERGQVNADGSVRDGWQTSHIEVVSGSFRFRVWNMLSNQWITHTVAGGVSNKGWYYVGYTYNKSTLTFTAYVNGVAVGSVTSFDRFAPFENSNIQHFAIGKSDATNMGSGADGRFWFGSFHLYSRPLTAAEILNNFRVSQGRFNYVASAGEVSLVSTAGMERTFSVFTGLNGVGTKTFTSVVSPSNAGITTISTGANTANIVVSSSVAAGTYTNTLTATDANNQTASYVVTITVNPRIIVSATTDTVTTTFGRIAYDTLTTTANTGTGNITFTRTSSSNSSAITHTSTIGSPAQAVMTIGNNLPAGTYFETFTATDAVGATTVKVITIIVNPPLTLTSATGVNSVETTYSRAATLRVNASGGTGSRIYSLGAISSSSGWKLSLDSSTANLNFVTISLGTFAAVGTHNVSVNVSDSIGVTATLAISFIVNPYPIINNIISENSYVTDGLIFNLDAANSASSSGALNWRDTNGAGNSATFLGSPAPAYQANVGSGSFFFDGTNSFLTVPNIGSSLTGTRTSLTNYTAEVWVRFNRVSDTNACLICESYADKDSINMALYLNGSGSITAGYFQYIGTTYTWTSYTTATNVVSTGSWSHVAMTVTNIGSTYRTRIYVNGVDVGGGDSLRVPNTQGNVYNIGKRWDSNERIQGNIGVVRVYNRGLSASEMLTNFNALRPRYLDANLLSASYATTQGGNVVLPAINSSLGTGNKSMVTLPVINGISSDATTANSTLLTVGPVLAATDSQTARTYVETITATDTTGSATSFRVNVQVNPPIILTAASASLTTTSGIETSTVITASQGTGIKTLSRASTANSGFSLSTATNQATLRVLATANPGTYWETITATDTSGATTSLAIQVVVNPPPALFGASRLVTTQGVLFRSSAYSVSGGTGALSLSLINSPTNSNITLTNVTSSGATIQVGAASAAGTYTSTLRVTDVRGAFSEIAVTVVVNQPVTLSGSLEINKVYGEPSVNGYTTNGTGTAPFSFSGNPVCAVVRTVSGSFTYERINGTDSCTWTAPTGVSAIDALLVGGGGGGGGDGGGGGGGGSINTLSSVSLPANRQVAVQVGSGGAGGIWAGPGATAGGATSLVSGTTTFTAPGGGAGTGCGGIGGGGGATGTGGSPTVGGAGGFGSLGTGCGPGNGSSGASGPSSSFTGVSTNFGGGGGGGVFPSGYTFAGPNSGGAGGGGTSASARQFGSLGLPTYFRALGGTPNAASNQDAFTTGLCGSVTGNINYGTDADFPCTQKDNFQGYATGFFIAPTTGSITFCLYSDDSSFLSINGQTLNKSSASTTWVCTSAISGFVQNQAYPINVHFTEVSGAASWKLGYTYSSVGSTSSPAIIPMSQLRSSSEGLAQYFNAVGSTPPLATAKTRLTNSSTNDCMERVGNINYSTDAEFPCTTKDNFQGYATGFFVSPFSGDITFHLESDDSSALEVEVNGTTRELLRPCCGESSATWSGFVQGQYYPIRVYFTEVGGAALWRLSYSYGSQAKIIVPVGNFRSIMDFTAPTPGTNGSGGGGGAGTAGLFKLSGERGGSGTVIIKYLTQSDTSTETFISALVESSTPTGLLTLSVPALVPAGTYSQVIKVQDAANSPPYQATVTINISKATPTARLSLPGGVTTATYGTPVRLTATTSTAGSVSFRKSGTALSGCSSVATSNGTANCLWTPSIVETASISVILTPTDLANFNSSVEAASTLSIVVNRADTLTVTASDLVATYSVNASNVSNTNVPNRSVTFSGLASIDSITAVSYSFSGTTNAGANYASSATAPMEAGTYSITPSAPVFSGTGSLSNYRAVVFTPATLTINRASRGSWSASYSSGSNVTTFGVGKTESPTVTFPGDGSRIFSTTSTVCSVNSSTGLLTTLGVGSCAVTASLTQTANWLSDTRSVLVTINRGIRTSSITPASSTIRYGDTTSVTAVVSPVLDSATVTFSAGSSTGCQIDNVSGEVTGIRALGSCSIRVTYDRTDLYESTTATASITINRALSPIVTTESLTAVSYTGSSVVVTPTYRVRGILARDIVAILPLADVSSDTAIAGIAASAYTAVGQYRFSAITPTAYDSTTSPTLGGTYSVFAQNLSLLGGLDIANYETPTYVPANLVISPIAQTRVSIQLSFLETITVPFDVSISGGSSSAAPTLAVLPGGTAQGCVVDLAVSPMRLKSSSPGTCIIQVTKPADRNFLVAVSDTQTVTILNFVATVPQFIDFSTGISISTVVPFTVGDSSCLVDCVPTITAVQDMNGVDMTDMKAGVPFRILGTNFNTATRVLFSAVIGGTMNSGVDADSFLIDNDSQITVIPPLTFQPNGTDSSSAIQVRVFVVASGGQSFPNRSIRTISR